MREGGNGVTLQRKSFPLREALETALTSQKGLGRGTLFSDLHIAPEFPERIRGNPEELVCKIQEELAGRTLPGGNFRIIVQPVHQNDLLASLVFSLIAGEDNCKDAQGDSMPQDGRYAHTFSIPLSPGDPPVSVTKTMERVILPRRILLAEDNDSNCFVATTFLTKFGYTVKCASNGQNVLELLPRENFDIILMDVQMPVLDGLETTKRIRTSRSRQWDPDIPIIALTAYAMKGDRERFLAAGMDEYVAKPVKFRDLFGTMDRVVLRKRLEKNASENHRF